MALKYRNRVLCSFKLKRKSVWMAVLIGTARFAEWCRGNANTICQSLFEAGNSFSLFVFCLILLQFVVVLTDIDVVLLVN